MSVKPIHINFVDENHKKNISPKEYEETMLGNWRHYINDEDDHDTGVHINNSSPSKWKQFQQKLVQVLQSLIKSEAGTQLEVFQGSMKYCLVIGQCIGLFPIMNITGRDVQKKYNVLSWRYSFCLIILLGQVIVTALSFYRIVTIYFFITSAGCDTISGAYNMGKLKFLKTLEKHLELASGTALFLNKRVDLALLTIIGSFIFFIVSFISNAQFIRLSTKWHHLMKLVATSKLDEYVDPYVKFKCDFAAIVLLSLCCIEHVFYITRPILKLRECISDVTDILKKLSVILHSFMFETVAPYSPGNLIIVEILVMIITIISTYSHVFIICVSLFLSSILEGLNKKIISLENQLMPATYWRAMREDYNRAVRLVRFFDDAINGVVFVTIGSSLFTVCSRLYYLFGRLNVHDNNNQYCIEQQNWYRYEDYVYNLFSSSFFILRGFWVSFAAAKIHSASLVAAPSLYSVPRSAFCTEIQRFLEQIHGTTVALTGLKFFNVTKELILSMVGIIVTYELVLMDFKKEE